VGMGGGRGLRYPQKNYVKSFPSNNPQVTQVLLALYTTNEGLDSMKVGHKFGISTVPQG